MHARRRAKSTQRFEQRRLACSFSGNWAPISRTRAAKPLRRKSVPNLGRSWGESSLQPFGCKLVRLQLGQIQVASTAIHLHLLHGHRPRSRPNQNPKSKIQTPNGFGFWILDFGFRILDFGFWISDFGFWVLDQFSLRSFCGGPKRPRLDFGFWISDFGFWISDFGLGLGLLRTVWILHKIFPSHADSGRRIPFPFSFTKWVENQICTFSPSFVANDGCFFVKMDVFSR